MAANSIEILSTRNLNPELVEKAGIQNIQIESISFIQNIPDVSTEIANEIKLLAAQKIVAVFTSIHAVEVVKSELPDILPSWEIFCTGGATKEALLEIFDEAAIAGTAKNASGLAEKILQQEHIKHIVFFCGKQRLNDLPETLQSNGIKVTEIIVYQTVGTPVTINKHYQGILFFSPSGVHSFFSTNTISVSVVLFSIGKTTTATIESYCSNKVITSQWPGEANLIELTIEYFGNTKNKTVRSTDE
ncbi:MAG: uroporphyrinogen-III synthase [Chitinophagaceae bacterium]|nr:uroporphyrinogen-III synthase [Chitinophagaceae bacterium]